MRQTNVCLNGVFQFSKYFTKICILGAHAIFYARKKVCDENQRKKDEKNDGCFLQVDQREVSAIMNYRTKKKGRASSLEILILYKLKVLMM